MVSRATATAAGIALFAVAACRPPASRHAGAPAAPTSFLVSDPRIDSLLSRAVSEFHLPGAAAALITRDSIWIGKAGVRKLGDSAYITLNDRFHIGSNTKAFTAVLAALAVEHGRLQWTTRPVELFPELADSINPALRAVTLTDLLQMRAGIEPFTAGNEFTRVSGSVFRGTPPEQRRKFLAYLLRVKPSSVGEFAYSNASYAMVGAMLERAFGAPWEKLVVDSVAARLGIDASLGWPAKNDPRQPWGHWVVDGKLVPHDPNSGYDLLSVINPVGSLALSIDGFARFVQFNLRGLTGTDGIISAASMQRLHTPRGFYAMGWSPPPPGLPRTQICTNVVFGPGVKASAHSGSAGTFYTEAWVIPEKGIAAAVMTNAALPNSATVMEELCAGLLRLRVR